MNQYLSKHRFCDPQIKESPFPDLFLSVVIPCYNEPDIITTLNSLKLCQKPKCNVEVIIVINSSKNASKETLKTNQDTKNDILNWIAKNQNNDLRFFVLDMLLPQKHAGVGLARKVGMDEAVFRFEQVNTDGVIVCLDADCEVAPNYFSEIEKHFKQNNNTTGCSIYYEHELSGTQFGDKIYEAIINYELFLRYYNQCLKHTGVPYAFHTVGSSMAVKSSAYQKQGGMNKRKAGEDFYFLHKIIESGHFSELNTTCVYPSPRVSDRVPFGTGRAVGHYLKEQTSMYMTYDFKSFQELRIFLKSMSTFYQLASDSVEQELAKLPPAIKDFLIRNNFRSTLEEINTNTKSIESFTKRFFKWLNAFRILKYIHFARDNYYPDKPILDVCKTLLWNNKMEQNTLKNPREMLLYFRKIER